jgi:cystathionine beta-lyase/cystathionine gamma-synthase
MKHRTLAHMEIVRFYTGLEDPDGLIGDIEQAFRV